MAKWENCVGYGLLSERPMPGAPGALYFTSDTGQGFRDNGISWDTLTLGVARQTIVSADDVVLSGANVVVFLTVAGKSVTLPDPAINTGLPVSVKSVPGGGGDPIIKNPDGSAADGTGLNAWQGFSDGTQWRWVDY